MLLRTYPIQDLKRNPMRLVLDLLLVVVEDEIDVAVVDVVDPVPLVVVEVDGVVGLSPSQRPRDTNKMARNPAGTKRNFLFMIEVLSVGFPIDNENSIDYIISIINIDIENIYCSIQEVRTPYMTCYNYKHI